MPAFWSLITVGLSALLLNSEPGHKFGYVNKEGREVIPAKYWQAWPFQNGFARCYGTNPNTGKEDWTTVIFVDKNGREYVSHLGPKDGNLSKPNTFLIDGKEIREDRSQTEVIEKSGIKFVRSLYRVYLVVPNEKKTIDAISLGWQGINPSTGNQWFLKDGQASEFTGAIGKSRVPGLEPVAMPQLIEQYVGVKTAMNEKYDYFGELSDGLIAARSRSKRWYYLRPDGSVAIELPANVCSTQPFSEGLAAVAVGGVPWIDLGGHSSVSPLNGSTFGFINKRGKFVIPPKFPCPATDWHSKFKDGLALATAEKNGTTSLGFINTTGEFVVPPKYLRLDDFSEGLAAFDASLVGFDPEDWQKRNRKDIRQFLRQYNIFSMNKSKLKKLLGEPNEHTKFPDADAYLLSSGCEGATYISIRYDAEDHVVGYTIPPNFWGWTSLTTNQTEPTEWIVSDQKPGVDEDFYTFFQRAKKERFIPPIIKPKSDRTANELFQATFNSPLGQVPFDADVWKNFPEKRRYMLFSLIHKGLYQKDLTYVEQLLGPPDRIDDRSNPDMRYYSLKIPDYDVAEMCLQCCPKRLLHSVLLCFKDENGIAVSKATAWRKTNPKIDEIAKDINKGYALVGMPVVLAHSEGFMTVEVASHRGPEPPVVEIVATPDKTKVKKMRVNFGAAKLSGYGDYSRWEDTNFYPEEKLVFPASSRYAMDEQDYFLLIPGKAFVSEGWKESPEKRYFQLFDLTHKHGLIGKGREDIHALLGQPDKRQTDDSDPLTKDCDYYSVRADDNHKDFFEIAYKDNCAIAYRVCLEPGNQIQHQKIWQKGGGLYEDNAKALKHLAPMLTKLVKWRRNAEGEYEPVR